MQEEAKRVFAVIINPVSGGGKNGGLTERICDALAQRGHRARVFATQGEGDAAQKTRQALSEGCASIVGVGGDGTLSEIVGALAGSDVPFYIVPSGTGNDFARALGLPRDPLRAFLAQLDGTPMAVDCGCINGRAFLNVSGSGFDVAVLRKTEELKAIYPGGKAYHKAVLAVLGAYTAFEAEVSIDGAPFEHEACTIVEVANGQYIGGGMRVAPGACVDDGLFDVVIVRRVPRRLIPLLLPLFIRGVHVRLPIARVRRARRVELRAEGMTVNIDGRLETMDEARFEIMPGALSMMRPVFRR